MTNNPTFTDNRGKTQTVEIGMKYAAGGERTITVEGFDVRDCGADDSRTGSLIVYGPVLQEGETETYPGWLYVEDLSYAIPTIDQMFAKNQK